MLSMIQLLKMGDKAGLFAEGKLPAGSEESTYLDALKRLETRSPSNMHLQT